MPTLRLRLNRKNDAGGYDPIHLETSTDLVLRPDGTTAENSFTTLASKVEELSGGADAKAHAATHAAGGSDPVTPAAIGAAPASHSHDGYAPVNHEHNYAGAATAGGAANTAVKLQNPRTFRTNLASTTAEQFDGSDNVSPGVTGILPVANGGTGRTDGAAPKLAVARNIRVNLASTAAASFDGSGDAAPGVTGVLPVANGGTGATSLPSLKEDLGLSSGGIELIPAIALGSNVRWANHEWIVVHQEGSTVYLALTTIYEKCQFGSNNTYAGSNLAARAMAFQNSLPADIVAKAVNTTVNGVTSKIFVASYEQMNGGFSWFNSNERRICKYNGTADWYWTSSPGSSSDVYFVSSDGGINYRNPTNTIGFRPFVAIKV